MGVLHAEVLEAFRSIDVPEDKAIRAAMALSASLTRVEAETSKSFSKRDADIDATRTDIGAIKLDVVGIKGELALHRWMLGILLATNVAILCKLFSH